MAEPLPCPFCGHVGVTHNEGSTFRWLTTECNGCGAQCGEERIDTLSADQGAAIEQAAEAAIKTWNTRAAERKPLTDEQLCMAWLAIPDPVGLGGKFSTSKEVRDFVRAIEAAHGIKEEM